MKNNNFWLICIFFVCCLIFGMMMGYVYKGTEIRNEMGVKFNCNAHTSKYLGRDGCKANVTIPKANITMIIDSNYDEISIIGK